MSKQLIDECVRNSLEGYFRDLRGTEPDSMHDMLVRAVEKPLLEEINLPPPPPATHRPP